MRIVIAFHLFLTVLSAFAQQLIPVRFSIRPTMLDLTNCIALPGIIQAPISLDSVNLEIVNWTNAPSTTNIPGEFILRFTQPILVGSVAVYDVENIEYLSHGKWQSLDLKNSKPQLLKILPFPGNQMVDGIKFIVRPTLKSKVSEPKPIYQATLQYATIFPAMLLNIASESAVAVSSADKPSEGFQPQPWVNRPQTIVDGFIDRSRNFTTVKRDNPITPENPEWITLAWDEPRTLRGLGFFFGSNDRGLGEFIIEQHIGSGDPRYAFNSNQWLRIHPVFTQQGKFRSNQFAVFTNSITTRGIRITSIRGGDKVGVGEIAAMTDARFPQPDSSPAKKDRVPIQFYIPEPGKVSIQIRDLDGNVIANPVAGVEFPAGTNIAFWTLDDVLGNPVIKPGKYRWHGLFVPGLKVEYKYTFYPNPLAYVPWQTEDRKGGWLADHEPPRTIARAGSNMWLGAFAEAGDSIVECDANGNKLWGIDRIWVAIPAEICIDGDWYFGWCEGGWIGDNQAIIQINTKTKASRKIFQREMPKKDLPIEELRKNPAKRGVTGFQVVGNLAFVSFGKLDTIQVFDISKNLAGQWRGFGWDIAYKQFEDQKPELIKEINLPSPGRIRKYTQDKLVTTSGKDVVLIDIKSFEIKPLFTGKLVNPLGLGVDSAGNLYIGEGEPLHQVFGFTPNGKIFAKFGKPGRREVGPFDKDDLEEPYGVEVGADGRVWVMEHTYYPKRVSIWDPETGKCVKAIYGPTEYGGGGCLDPADDNRAFYRGIEFRRNPKTGEITPVNLYYRPDSKKYARFSEDNYPEYAFRSEGKLWMTSFMHPHEHPILVLWQYKNNHVMPVAAMGSAVALRETFGEKPPGKADRKDWQNTDSLTNHIKGYSPDQKFFVWTDFNEDGFVQPDELKFGKLIYNDKLLTHAYAGWNWRMNEKFEAAANAGQGRLIFFKPKGRTKQGYPIYDVPTNTVAGSGEGIGVDSRGNAIVLGGPLTCVQPDGRIRWIYRNDWPGLHAGHRTTARGDEPGVLIAPTRIWGFAYVNEELGEVVAFNSNLGCTYLMTCDDGLYIDRVFRDQRIGLLWRMPFIPPPEMLAETSLYDEHFGGTFQKARSADGKEHFYYICGKNHSTVIELSGLEKIKRLKGGTIDVTPEQIAAANERRHREAAKKNLPKIYKVKKVKPAQIVIDGKDNEWTTNRIDGFALAYDDENLYVLFKGRDDRAVFENKGENIVELFKTGDVVDVMLQTQPGIEPSRAEPGVGDIRISFSMFKGKPVCVLYDYKVPDFKGERVPFSSPWRTVWCDRVIELTNARIRVTRGQNEFTLEAAVPLADIHFSPDKIKETRGDVGRVLSDQTGSAVSSRVYWSNKYTAIMSDLPSEATVVPNLWGLFSFEN